MSRPIAAVFLAMFLAMFLAGLSAAPATVCSPAHAMVPGSGPVAASSEDDLEARLRQSLVRISVSRAGLGVEIVTEGAGFLIDDGESDGGGFFIVTSLHVVRGGIRATLHSEQNETSPIAEVVAIDDYWDLALLRADLPDGDFAPLPLADGIPDPGSIALLPVLEHLSDETETIEGEPRRLLRKEGSLLDIAEFAGGPVLRADTRAAHGDSGSPLMDAEGQVVLGVVGILDEYEQTDRVVTYAIPAARVRALVDAARGEAPVASPFSEFHRQHLMDPMIVVEAVAELVGRRDRSLAEQLLELTMKNSHKLSAPMPREGHYYNVLLLRQRLEAGDAADKDRATLRDVVAAAQAALPAPAPRLIDELVLADCRYFLGDARRKLGAADAHTDLLQALVQRPDHVDALVALADLAIRDGREFVLRKYVRTLRSLLGADAEVITRLIDDWRDAARG